MTGEEMIDHVRRSDLSQLMAHGQPAELAPPDQREVLAVRTVRLSPAVYERLSGFAAGRGVGTSVLMRQIIEEWVSRQVGTVPARSVVRVDEIVAFLNRAARPGD